MAKNPILPVYYNDLRAACLDMSDEEFGMYFRLLMEQWDKKGLPKDYQRLTRLCTSFDKNWPLLKTKFVERDGKLFNENMEEIRNKRDKYSEKQKENVLKRYQKPTKHDTKQTPLENEYENEIVIQDKGVQGEKDFEIEELKPNYSTGNERLLFEHYPPYFANEPFHSIWNRWYEHLKAKGKVMTMMSEEAALADLYKTTVADSTAAIEIINYSMGNGWVTLHVPDKKNGSDLSKTQKVAAWARQ